MPLSALLLVLLAAVLHASWNFAAKRAGGDQRFTLLTSLMTSLIWLPAGLWFGWDEVPRWGLVEWGVVAGSAMPKARMRRMLATLVAPAIFDLDKLREDFPKESIDTMATANPSESSVGRRRRQA